MARKLEALRVKERGGARLGTSPDSDSRPRWGRHPHFGRAVLIVLALCLAAWVTPVVALAQSSGPQNGATPIEQPQATPANQKAGGLAASPAASPAVGTPVPANPAAQPSAAAKAPPAGLVAGVPTPVGANVPKETAPPTSLFAYLLIILAAIWFALALIGIYRLLTQPRYRGPYPVELPPSETSRSFLSFGMPFLALICLAIIIGAWGILFLQLARLGELYPLAVDLLIICLVMFVATFLALRGPSRRALQ